MRQARRNIMLVADDFGISAGVSDGIADLAQARRLSGTSALVTLPRWRGDGGRLGALRESVAVGLHFNLTLGAPLGGMPSLAPDGRFPALNVLVRRAVTRQLLRVEIEAEALRQFEAFRAGTGHAPDFIDGHQHVHALPFVREAVIAAALTFFEGQTAKPLVRVPSDRPLSLMRRKGARRKALILAALSGGFGRRARAAGFPTNDSFAGATPFGDGEEEVRREFGAAAESRGRLHLVMCHPGIPDGELAALDPVTRRRGVELAVLAQDNALSARLWHPQRELDGTINWWEAGAHE